MSNEFLTRVSFAGVPHNIPHSSDISLATLFPMDARTVCQIYWMLSKINVSYSYKINNVTVSRNFSAVTTVVPKSRIISPATFYVTGYDSQTQTSYVLELHLNRVYFESTNFSNFGLNLTFEESDNFSMVNLGLRIIPGMNHIAYPFNLFGKPLTAYLNYDRNMVTSAQITDFSMTSEFFEI